MEREMWLESQHYTNVLDPNLVGIFTRQQNRSVSRKNEGSNRCRHAPQDETKDAYNTVLAIVENGLGNAHLF